MSSNCRKETETFFSVSPTDFIPITSFDSITISFYFFNSIINDILLYLPISNQ